MEGYIIAFEIDSEEGQKISYWTGSSFTEDIAKSQFFTSALEARPIAGSLQSQYIDRTVKIIPAKNGIHF